MQSENRHPDIEVPLEVTRQGLFEGFVFASRQGWSVHSTFFFKATTFGIVCIAQGVRRDRNLVSPSAKHCMLVQK